MLRAALDHEQPAMLFSDLDPIGQCICCGRPRPIDLVCTWLCQQCKRLPLYEFCLKVKARLS